MRRYDIMFATIDSLRSEESLRLGDPHSRAMVEIKEKEETERESVFTFSPRSRRPAPPRCCPKMTSALVIKKSPGRAMRKYKNDLRKKSRAIVPTRDLNNGWRSF